MRALLHFRPLLKAHLKAFGLAFLLSLVTLAAGTALLGVSGWFITATALTATGVSFNLFAPSAAVRGLSFVRILARYGEKLVGHDATLRLLSDLRQWLFGALFPRLPLDRRTMSHGDLVSRLTADIDALDTVFLVAIGPVVALLMLGGIVSTALFVILPAAGWLYLLALFLAAIAVPIGLISATRHVGFAIVRQTAVLRGRVLDAVAGHDDIVAFGQEDSVAVQFMEATNQLARLRNRLGIATGAAGFAVQGLTGAALVGTLIVGLDAFERGTLAGPVLVGLLLAVLGSFEATNAIVRSVGKFGNALAAAERLRELAESPLKDTDNEDDECVPRDTGIVFEDVHFAYDGVPVLAGTDLVIDPGEHLAITGPSGAGKSTLLNLLLRLETLQEGHIRLGGADISKMGLENLHARIALLSQESPVFLDTVRNNLTIARPEATDDKIWAALRTARLEETIRALPEGLDTLVGEGGSTLSTGQCRRLCLARTLLSSAGVVLLDEPTTGLDRETETAFLNDIKTVLAGRTVLLVTHAALPAEAELREVMLTDGMVTHASS